MNNSEYQNKLAEELEHIDEVFSLNAVYLDSHGAFFYPIHGTLFSCAALTSGEMDKNSLGVVNLYAVTEFNDKMERELEEHNIKRVKLKNTADQFHVFSNILKTDFTLERKKELIIIWDFPTGHHVYEAFVDGFSKDLHDGRIHAHLFYTDLQPPVNGNFETISSRTFQEDVNYPKVVLIK